MMIPRAAAAGQPEGRFKSRTSGQHCYAPAAAGGLPVTRRPRPNPNRNRMTRTGPDGGPGGRVSAVGCQWPGSLTKTDSDAHARSRRSTEVAKWLPRREENTNWAEPDGNPVTVTRQAADRTGSPGGAAGAAFKFRDSERAGHESHMTAGRPGAGLAAAGSLTRRAGAPGACAQLLAGVPARLSKRAETLVGASPASCVGSGSSEMLARQGG
jgi:hypothetical protein